MSYDYNALVSQIAISRREAAEIDEDDTNKILKLQQSIDAFSTLAAHCPMTPLLWMQYAADTAELLQALNSDNVQETRLQMLELALAEFPGSAILQLHYLQLLVAVVAADDKKAEIAIDKAIQNVGRGSHRNEGNVIAAIFRMAAQFFAKSNRFEDALEIFIQRASVPMKEANDGIVGEIQQFCQSFHKPVPIDVLRRIEESRRYESKIFGRFASIEDEIDAAMHEEAILARAQVNLEEIDWNEILRSDEKTCWMGLGGKRSADAFIRYAQACFRCRIPRLEDDIALHDNLQNIIKDLAISVYERGVAECPTVEALWLSYIRHLVDLAPTINSIVSRLQDVVARAVRNCPYSLRLFQQRLNSVVLSAKTGISVFDPDQLMEIVQEAISNKFLTSPTACLELHLTAIQAFKRHILFLLASSNKSDDTKTAAYDDAEAVSATPKKISAVDQATEQELQDFCEDIREMYDAVDSYLRKNHTSWSEGRYQLWKDRAQTETHLIAPLLESLGKQQSKIEHFSEITRIYEKLTKVHQPAHPNCYSLYIQSFLGAYPAISPGHVISKLRQVRNLYQRAVKETGRPKQSAQVVVQTSLHNFETALHSLCQDYLDFERLFGSDESLSEATRAIQKKFVKFQDPREDKGSATPSNVDPNYNKEKSLNGSIQEHNGTESIKETNVHIAQTKVRSKGVLERKPEEDATERPIKRQKTINPNNEEGEPLETSKTLEHQTHKVRIGNLEHPAHPFTVRVANLSEEAEDMDLVDIFRPKCGAIVHARIVREKHQHGKGKSKGWGLIQFEEREAVEKALQLSEVIGVKGKLVKVERSHMPASTLVPPGFHRVNPKGEGRVSKRNQKRKELHANQDDSESGQKDSESSVFDQQKNVKASANNEKAKASGAGIIAFRPRAVTRGAAHHRVKISLSKASNKSDNA